MGVPSDILAIQAGNRGKLTNIIYADVGMSSLASQDGSSLRPMALLGDALGIVPTATTVEEMQNDFYIIVAPGQYDEAIDFDVQGKRVMLMSWGAWTLGVYDAIGWQFSGPTRRNIRLFGDSTRIDVINTAFGITVMNTSLREGQQGRSWMGPSISGQILMEANGGAMQVHLECEVLGDTGNSSGVSINDDLGNADQTSWSFDQCRIRGAINLANGQIKANQSRFEGDVIQTGGGYHRLRDCDLQGNFQSALFFGGERPTGIFDSEIAGDLVAITPGDEFELDATTADKYAREGGTLQNGAVIDFQFSGGVASFAGGGTPTSGQFFEQNGTAAAGVAGVLGESTRQLAVDDRFLTELAFQTATATATTQFDVVVDGSTVETVTLTGAAGVVDLSQARVLRGQNVAVRYNGIGTAPGPSTVQVYGR